MLKKLYMKHFDIGTESSWHRYYIDLLKFYKEFKIPTVVFSSMVYLLHSIHVSNTYIQLHLITFRKTSRKQGGELNARSMQSHRRLPCSQTDIVNTKQTKSLLSSALDSQRHSSHWRMKKRDERAKYWRKRL